LSNDTMPAGAYPWRNPHGHAAAHGLHGGSRPRRARGAGADLAGQLTPEGFAQWMEYGEAIRAGTAQGNREAP
jgi:hypothetical protein